MLERNLHRWAAVLALAVAVLPAVADVGPPAHLRVTEREAGLFATQWRVPKALPPRAVPVPQLAETCKLEGEFSVDDQAGAWLFTQDFRCETGLAGEVVRLRYPFADLALTTVVRVELLSGDRFAHVSSPGEAEWRLPEGTAAPDRWGDAARAVTEGIVHVFGSWAHLPFVLAIGLLGSMRRSIRVVTIFTLGQIAGILLPWEGTLPAEATLALASVLIAREALRPDEERSRILPIAAIAGVAHGLAAPGVLAVLGMDAAHLVAVTVVAAVAWRGRRVLAYASGAVGFALAVGLAVAGGVAEPEAAKLEVPSVQADTSTAGLGSRRLGPAAPDSPIQSFLVVEPFEIRHEVLLRLGQIAESVGLEPGSIIEVSDQAELSDRLIAFVADNAVMLVDGKTMDAARRRADFLTVDATGALPRPTPVPEPVVDAVVGVVLAYPTSGMPAEVAISWDPYPEAAGSIPATTIDPEAVGSMMLTVGEPALTWTNNLSENPIPAVDAIAVEPVDVVVPLVSLLLIVAAIIIVIRWRGEPAIAAVRVIVAVAIVAGPFNQVTVASLPGTVAGTPSERQARRILAGLLPNVYRAMDYRDESTIYDRLAVSVTGDTLTEVYLEQRRTLELEERGGAQARVEAVEILEAWEIEGRDEGFDVRAVWTAAGMVTHFGHRHFRQNRYDARVTVVPVDGTWKIRSIEILEQDRLK